ncbi:MULTISPECIES: 2-hydroxy-3-keto-5-methylthiopentenyl-1-phosphate phosphatase [unclassified Cytobacillus]|uniref:2-hydroxy-3-keto-5-methylthiopentenyl-1- phosphate phosphatase n=1 Tax=unclassified Cytobacillus TaxID=2675268 RepID=UPI001356E5C9|nr:2-hydroxy-3-keto-5-methylthiopentenyl-1-phosphate phosphatase [Cytobacillus sp. AMY 15.2]KAF0816187.1 2-hydroxy-3-keto-5-methylthiopentenyl-1- phosphate phosphatase [Bacillus sp. ZZV12-4809]MCM3090294.1 2-hydroxy-3-keto-5-methylthiopentenyl-1-phosphate phosphatase [Cytobacillus sp. AMY 15.2]
MAKIGVFCDFDGTITESDNIINIMKHFAPPQWEGIKNQVLNQEISIKEGVGKMFSLLPSNLKGDLTDFILENAKIRDGFQLFADYLAQENIPLYIVSGGIDFFVTPVLEKYGPFKAVFCNSSDFSGDKIKILWPHSCDEKCENNCGCCKPSIMRRLEDEDTLKVVIGDSVTDLEAAKQADFVIARDLLLEKSKEMNLNHNSFETFYDCIEVIKKLNEVRV